MDLSKRKQIRLKDYNYGQQGAYFITICVNGRKKILSNIVGTGVLDCPQVNLKYHGIIAEKYINQLSNFYNDISVDKYVIMPDHIHLLITILKGQSGTPVPTNKNSVISNFVSTFKRFCNREYGNNIWQPRYYDHIIRNQEDYNYTWEYIENNPIKWLENRID